MRVALSRTWHSVRSVFVNPALRRMELALAGLPAPLFLRRCLRLDATLRPPEGIDLLRGIPIFAPKPQAAVEALARHLVPEETAAGSLVVREGERSDRFLVIRSGRVEVTQDGRHVRHEGPGPASTSSRPSPAPTRRSRRRMTSCRADWADSRSTWSCP